MRSGNYVPDRCNDLLSSSIGTAEHPGRLRGHPTGYVGVKSVYGSGKRRTTSRDVYATQIEEVHA